MGISIKELNSNDANFINNDDFEMIKHLICRVIEKITNERLLI